MTHRITLALFVFSLFFTVSFSSLAWSQEDVPIAAPEPSIAPKPSASPEPNAATEAPKPEESPTEKLAGHSYHGEVFNEGPRQRAYLMGGTGDVHFPVTTKNDEVQKFFDQSIGQLHGFWYFEAERSFRHAAMLDPDCAMAYWGAAMANLGNEKRAKGFIEQAIKRKANASEREVMYIDAINAYLNADKSKSKERNEAYTKALEDILLKFPDDLEAKALLVLHQYNARSSGTSNFAIDALMQQIFAVQPMHPVHHYRIHLWDYRKPEVALTSAATCGQTSPGIAHMWHMPGHIYSRLKRYDDACWQQEASARVDHAHMMRDRVLPDQIHNFAHNNEWLIRNLIHVGRVQDAIDLAKNMIELPRHPNFNTLDKRGSTYYGRLRLFEVLNKYELWHEMIQLSDTMYLEPTDKEDEQLKQLRFLAKAHYALGHIDQGNAQLALVEPKLNEEKMAQEKAIAEAEEKAKQDGKDQKQIDADKDAAKKKSDAKVRKLEKIVFALQGYKATAEGDLKTGIELLVKAGDEDRLYLARLRSLAGEHQQAENDARAQVNSNKNEILPLVCLTEVLWNAGKKEDSSAAFEQLREISSSIQLGARVFERLMPIAAEVNLPQDWRVQKPPQNDVGQRPDLNTLGPFRWTPSAAPDWTLNDAEGHPHSLKQFQGRPVIVIFYLGYGCLHCAEQLQAFAPRMKEFEDAGIAMIAISSDDAEGLKVSIDNYEGGPLPIPLVANAELDVFKAYRAYDDFESQPLHGTFLIDGDGLVRWQDISYEPFMNHTFLLQEAQRLLSQAP